MRKGWLLVVCLLLAWTPAVSAQGIPPFHPFDVTVDHFTWGRIEYLLYWMSGQDMPPIVTTGTVASGGVLGANGTQVLFGNDRVKFGAFNGGRLTLGTWFDSFNIVGAEVSAFSIEQRSVVNNFSNATNSFLAIPFVNATTNAQNATIIANTAGGIRGTIQTSNSTRLWGGSADAIISACRIPWLEVQMIGGVRYLDMHDQFLLGITTSNPAVSSTISDSFITRNRFFGGEIGGRLIFRCEVFYLEGLGTITPGIVEQEVEISGNSQNSPGQGFFARSSNSGDFQRRVFAFSPRLQARVGMDLSSHFKIFGGYDFLYISEIARPGQQIDTSISLTPPPPTFQFHSRSFVAQGLHIGAELRY